MDQNQQLPLGSAPPPPAAPPAMHSVPLAPPVAARDGGFAGGRPVLADPGGFVGSSEVRWTVERIVPPDGVLGTHFGAFSVEDLGQNYGEGTYQVTRQDPQNRGAALTWTKKIGSSYGPRKAPKQVSDAAGAAQGARPFFHRPWAQAEGGYTDPATGAPAAPRIYPYYPFSPDFQRPPAAPPQDNVAAEALRQMGQQNMKILEQQEKARTGGPDAQVSKILEAQQDMMNRRWEEERTRDEARRRVDEEKWERRQKEERDRFDREQQAARDAHTREMERIRAENETRLAESKAAAEERERRDQERQKFLLDLEDKRSKILQQEVAIHQQRLESELSRTREEVGKLQERTAEEIRESRTATEKAMERNQTEVNERLQRDRDGMDREFKLREKGLDKEHELSQQILEIKRQQLDKESGDQVFNTIQSFVKEAARALEKIVDLQKMQSMTPEAQVAAIQRGSIDGNVVAGPGGQPKPEAAQQQAPRPQEAAPQRQAAADSAQKPGGNGREPQPITPESAADRMEMAVRKALETPEGRETFQTIISEWALHVSVGNDPAPFATFFLEMMRNEKDGDMRRFCTGIFTIVSAREWSRMLGFLRPYLDPETTKVFEKPEAEAFYEAWRAMVYHEVRAFWKQVMEAARNEQPIQAQPAQQVPAPQPPPQQEAPPEEQPQQPGFQSSPPAPAPPPTAPAEGTPVPTWEALKQQQQGSQAS